MEPSVPTQRALAVAGEWVVGGVGVHESVLTASLRAVVGAFRRLHRLDRGASERPSAPHLGTQPVA